LRKGKETDDLFIALRGNSIKVNTLYSIIRRHSARHIAHHTPSGFGPHAMRHIGATAFLKQNPGAFPLVAQLLNDKLETVMHEYGHLGHQDGFRRYEDLWQPKAT
jgi:integrase